MHNKDHQICPIRDSITSYFNIDSSRKRKNSTTLQTTTMCEHLAERCRRCGFIRDCPHNGILYCKKARDGKQYSRTTPFTPASPLSIECEKCGAKGPSKVLQWTTSSCLVHTALTDLLQHGFTDRRHATTLHTISRALNKQIDLYSLSESFHHDELKPRGE